MLLFTWLLGLLVPLFHRHEDHAAADDAATAALASGPEHGRSSNCSGRMRDQAPEPSIAAECPNGGDCSDPFHHHHPHPSPGRDAVGCSICASLLDRSVVPVAGFAIAPLAAHRVAAPLVRVSPPSERSVFAQARGPPAGAFAATWRNRLFSTVPLRA